MRLIKSGIYLFLLIFLAGCMKNETLRIVIGPTDVDGVLQIKNDAGILLSENLNRDSGFFQITAPKAGFYELSVFQTGKDALPPTYVYLDGEEVHINMLNTGYPIATSNSAVQKDVARYYSMLDSSSRDLLAAYNAAQADFEAEFNKTSDGPESHRLVSAISVTRENYSKAGKRITERFIGSNPGSIFSAFLLDKIGADELSAAPRYYQALFAKLDDAAKGSFYGKSVDARIRENMKAAVGTPLPPIIGETVTGQAFDATQIKGKLTLIAFWRSLNKDSARDMVELKDLYKKHHKAGLEILGISFDKTPERWKTFVRTNDLRWINICDFQGAASGNLKNFNTDRLPFYFLVGRDGKIKARDLQLSELPIYLKEHLAGSSGSGQ